MRKLVGLATALLAIVPGVAQAQSSACLTAKEFSSLAAYALPSAISGATKRCGPSLNASSFLKAEGQTLANRYASHKTTNWPDAKAAFFKISGDKKQTVDILRSLPDDSLREMIDVILEGMVSQEIPLEKCGTIDSYVRLLAPLPPENTSELIALTISLSTANPSPKMAKLNICKS